MGVPRAQRRRLKNARRGPEPQVSMTAAPASPPKRRARTVCERLGIDAIESVMGRQAARAPSSRGTYLGRDAVPEGSMLPSIIGVPLASISACE